MHAVIEVGKDKETSSQKFAHLGTSSSSIRENSPHEGYSASNNNSYKPIRSKQIWRIVVQSCRCRLCDPLYADLKRISQEETGN